MTFKSVIFLSPYPLGEAPSQRFRFEQYLSFFKKNSFEYSIAPFYSIKAWNLLYKDGKYFQKAIHLFIGLLKRVYLLFKLNSFDIIFIHREASPIGPPWFELVAARIMKKKIIYDFDDAIWLEDHNEKGTIISWLKCKWKIKNICEWSYKISAGNYFLAEFARQFNSHVTINPTTIDVIKYHNPELYSNKKNQKVVIGWTGTHSTFTYLKPLIPIIKSLQKEFSFKFLIISNKKPDFDIESLDYIQWTKDTEIEDLMQIDIGIMPLTDDDWSKGKCGFKALQYSALGKPAVVSPVGVNETIVQHGVTGFHCHSSADWVKYLKELIENKSKRFDMGKAGRAYIMEDYSVTSNSKNFLSLFDSE